MIKNFLNNSKLILVIYLQSLLFIALFLVFLMELSKDVYQIILVFIFFECVLLSFVSSFFNIYQLFLFVMLLFNVVQPLFEFLGWYSFPENNTIMPGITEPIEDKTLAETYKVLITMLIGTSIGWLMSMLKLKKHDKRAHYLSQKFVSRNRYIYKYLFFLLLLLTISHNILLLLQSFDIGYVQTIHLQSKIENIPLILRASEVLYPLLGCIMLFMSKNNKSYRWYAFLFLAPYAILAFTGLRGEFVAIFLTIIFIYRHKYGISNISGIILIGIFLFLLMTIIGIYRFSSIEGVFEVVSNTDFFSLFTNMLVFNGVSIAVISYTIQLQYDFFNNIPFIFGYFFAIFSFAPNYTYVGVQEKNYLAQHITYLLNPEKLYGGSTIGTAMGAEFYELSSGNFLIIFLLSALLLYVAGYLINNLYKNKFMFYIGFLYVQALILSPRGSVMKLFNKETIVVMAIYLIVVFFFSMVKAQKSSFK